MTASDEDLQELIERLEGQVQELDELAVDDPTLTRETLDSDRVLDAIEDTIDRLRER